MSRSGLRAVVSLLIALAIVPAATSAHAASEPSGSNSSDGPLATLESLVDDAVGSSATTGVSGQEAIGLLEEAGATADVAASVSMHPDELVTELTSDPSMFVTADAMVGYVDRLDGAASLPAPVAPSAEELSAPSGADVFSLNSLPSSSRVIFLDFDGHVTPSNTPWNARIDSAPYASAGTLTQDQRDAIYTVWARTSEDYLPFGVNVTTADPGQAGLVRSSDQDQAYGQRVVISPTNWVDAPSNQSTLGIAFVPTFGEIQGAAAPDTPAFVFTANVSRPLAPSAIADAASHESGHSLGLSHDASTTSNKGYYDGHNGWAPIMGRPVRTDLGTGFLVGQDVTQWSRGEYANSNNAEDDVALIAKRAGLRGDDHGGTPETATLIGPVSTTGGFIGTGGDVDSFAFDAGLGTVNVTVRPAVADISDLHAQIVVRDPQGATASAVPQTLTNWSSSVSFPASVAGRYTVEVSPIGWRTPFTGFSSYASMGAYLLDVSAQPPSVSEFRAVPPSRLLDTRTGEGGAVRIPGGGQIRLQVAGRQGVPVGATAAVLSVVAVDPVGPGYLTTFPCTPNRLVASTVNFVAGQIVANTAIATLSPTGEVCIYAHATTDVVVDVTGWLGSNGGSLFNTIGPTRVMDTRSGLGGSGRLAAGGTARLDVSALPAGTTAVALNVTSDGASGPGFATVYPCATGLPGTSTINYVAGDTRPNNTIVGIDGGVCVYALSATDIVVDLVGWFGPTGLSYLPTSPTRLLDTRASTGYLGAGATVSYRPAVATLGAYDAVAAAVNVTAVDHTTAGFVTTYGCAARPTTSTVNAVVGQVNANGAIVPLAGGLDSCLFTQSGGNLVVDLNGWWVR